MAKIRFLDKLFGFMGIEEEDPVESLDEELDDEDGEVEESTSGQKGRSRGRVVNIHSQKQVKLIVAEPTSFDEVQGIADHIKAHRPVIVNLESIDRDLAKRMVDFLSGVTYALDGAMQKVGEGIFLLTPDNFDVAGDIQSSLPESEEYSWRR